MRIRCRDFTKADWRGFASGDLSVEIKGDFIRHLGDCSPCLEKWNKVDKNPSVLEEESTEKNDLEGDGLGLLSLVPA